MFARFGRTVLQAHVFDHAVVDLLAVVASSKTEMSRDQLDATFETLLRKTSGVLVKIAGPTVLSARTISLRAGQRSGSATG